MGPLRPHADEGPAKEVPGLGDGARVALEIIDVLCREFPIDVRRIYVTGQSMGGAGVWNVIANRPHFFAASVVCCGSVSTELGSESIDTPLWNFHGDSDKTVPLSTSRDRMAARRKAGGHPLYRVRRRRPQRLGVGVHGTRAGEVGVRPRPRLTRRIATGQFVSGHDPSAAHALAIPKAPRPPCYNSGEIGRYTGFAHLFENRE